jgi:hypothetical protein
MRALSTLKPLIPKSWRNHLRELQAALSLGHVGGPTTIDTNVNEAVVTCLVKNGEFYIDQFIDHYFSLGVRHICFLDNGSSDDTVKRALRHKNITMYRSNLPVGGRQGLLKKHLAERAVRFGWCLDVDIDEFFDYPYSDSVSLPRFLEYLNAKRFTAVVAHMLDMFSERPLAALAQRQQENLKEVYRYYDVSQVTKVSYGDDPLTIEHGSANQVGSAETALYWGGIRKTVYGFTCLLTKHPLFRTGAGVQLFPHNHYVNRARLADVSAILMHYKFASNASEEAMQNRAAFTALSGGYSRIIDAIMDRPDFRIKTETAREFRRASDLLENRFLFASPDYRSYVRTRLVDAVP